MCSVQTSNGIQAQEQGQLKQNTARASAEEPAAFIAVQGQFSYTAPDGQQYTVRYGNYYFLFSFFKFTFY